MVRGLRLPLEQLWPYLLEVPKETERESEDLNSQIPDPTSAQPLDLAELFGNANPVELEVGFGKGLFLLSASESRPDVNFLGIEIERKYALYAATRLAKRQRSNVRVICADAKAFLPGVIADHSFQAVHVYFPDPWWKNRHRKRRLFTPDFAGQCLRILKPNGLLHVVSDVEDYFHIITGIVAAMSELELLPPPGEKTPAHDMDYLTNFDRKYRKEGRPIYRASYLRRELSRATHDGGQGSADATGHT